MHIHILGICGTFMGGIALLARAAGHTVTGSDANVYPPMSTQLEAAGISLMEGYRAEHLQSAAPDAVVVGNALSRGNPAVEWLLDSGLPYTSGPQWLAEHVLLGRWVLAVAGTHGKTTTSSLLAWLLEDAGLNPGFLIGGVPLNFGVSARLTASPFFVVEADEYDTAFFDKRSKFVHYRPRTAILNNLEYDHADIFPDVAAIQRQFHHLVRTVPRSGLIVYHAGDARLRAVLAQGCWSATESFAAAEAGADWSADSRSADASHFAVRWRGAPQGVADSPLIGLHNLDNTLAAIAAARHAGVPVAASLAALPRFRNVRRRLELRGTAGGVAVYDDFAHHPTAITLTLAALRARAGAARILAVLEPRSNTMRLGVHRDELAAALQDAQQVFVLQPPELPWSLQEALAPLGERLTTATAVDALVAHIAAAARPGDQVLVMSNGSFGGLHQKLLTALATKT